MYLLSMLWIQGPLQSSAGKAAALQITNQVFVAMWMGKTVATELKVYTTLHKSEIFKPREACVPRTCSWTGSYVRTF